MSEHTSVGTTHQDNDDNHDNSRWDDDGGFIPDTPLNSNETPNDSKEQHDALELKQRKIEKLKEEIKSKVLRFASQLHQSIKDTMFKGNGEFSVIKREQRWRSEKFGEMIAGLNRALTASGNLDELQRGLDTFTTFCKEILDPVIRARQSEQVQSDTAAAREKRADQIGLYQQLIKESENIKQEILLKKNE